MKKEKRPLNLITKTFYLKTITGFFKLICGIIGLLGSDSTSIIAAFLLISASTVQMIFSKINSEPDDELSKYNYLSASNKASDITELICSITVCIILFISLFFISTGKSIDFKIDWIKLIYFPYIITGIKSIITGFIFKKLEKE